METERDIPPTGEPASDPGPGLAWEANVLVRARRGERAAIAELYGAFAGPLYARVLLPRLGQAAAAEDALAETFRTALERLGEFEGRGVSIWRWLVRIAVHKATDEQRKAARRGRLLVDFAHLVAPEGDEAERPGDALAARERAVRLTQRVMGALESVNARYRRAIELRFLEDRSREECAAALEVKLGTFDVLLLRALRSFRERFGEEE